MGEIIRRENSLDLCSPSRMSSELSKILFEDTQYKAICPWTKPKNIPQNIMDESRSFINIVENNKHFPSQDIITKWLKSLAPLIESKKSLEEIEIRTSAMASILKYPNYCFTETTIEKFARTHKFLPTYQDLCEFFDGIVADVENKLWKCRKLTEDKEYFSDTPIKDEAERNFGMKMFGDCIKAIKEVPDDN